jgi:hypothetical protein
VKPSDLLIVGTDDLTDRFREVHRRLDESAAFRDVVLADPAGTLTRAVFPDAPLAAPSTINRGNRLFFSLLSNEPFMSWLREYQDRLIGRATRGVEEGDRPGRFDAFLARVDLPVVYADIAEAAVRFVDKELLYSLIAEDPDYEGESVVEPGRRPMQEPSPLKPPVLVWAVAVAVIVAVVVAIEFWGPPIRQLTREDLQRVADQMVDPLTERAAELRRSGALASPEGLRRGRVL